MESIQPEHHWSISVEAIYKAQSASVCYLDTIFSVMSVSCLMSLYMLDGKWNGAAHHISFIISPAGKGIPIMNESEVVGDFYVK